MTAEWEKSEQEWWQRYYTSTYRATDSYRGSCTKPQGIRHYYREMLFRRVRSELAGKLWIDVGAGNSSTIADLIHPNKYAYRYIAADVSMAGLADSRLRTGQTPIVGSASHLPFAPAQAHVVSAFGVLYILQAWEQTLHTMVDLLKPGGYLMLHDAITKPRMLGRWRKRSYTARFDSPHRGGIEADKLQAILTERCEILLWDCSGSPLQFALLWFGKLDRVALRSYRITQLIVTLDKLWLASMGKLRPSLSAGEIAVLAKKR